MIYLILGILATHFIADFILQTDKQALNKSSSNFYLSYHVSTYFIGLMAFATIHMLFVDNVLIKYVLILWAVINAGLHWITDYFTSRLNVYLWEKHGRHLFFIGVGADQLIHYICLFVSYDLLIGLK